MTHRPPTALQKREETSRPPRLLGGYVFFMIANVVVLSSFANAIFLAEYDAPFLPLLFILSALATCLATILYQAVSSRPRYQTFHVLAPLAFAGMLAACRLALGLAPLGDAAEELAGGALCVESRELPIRRGMVTALGLDGQSSALVVEQVEGLVNHPE